MADDSDEDDNIISSTPIKMLPEASSSSSSKINRPKMIYTKENINNLVYYPGELSRPKHPSAFKPRNYDSKQIETNFLRMICEITELQSNEKFRFPNVRTVGTYIIFKNSNHLKDTVTGHRIEIDFTCQFYDKTPSLHSNIMIMGTIKYKTCFKDNKKIFVPYIVVKMWDEWSGKINFQQFYYNARRFRSPQVDETIPIEDMESSSDDLSEDEDFEKTEFFEQLQKDGLLNKSTFVVSNDCSMSSVQDFEKTDFLNNLEKEQINTEPSCEETDASLFEHSDNSVIL